MAAALRAVVDEPAVSEQIDEPVTLLLVIAVLLGLLGLLIGALTVLFVRATRPRPLSTGPDGRSPVVAEEGPPVTHRASTEPARRSPVLRLRTHRLLRPPGRR
jgi:hypothetical protein